MRQILLALSLVAVPGVSAQSTLRWSSFFDTTDDRDAACRCATLDPVGDVIVTGYTSSLGSGADLYAAKYGAGDGRLLWDWRFNGPDSDFGVSVACDSRGDVVVLGSSNSRIHVVKLRGADGVKLWEYRQSPMRISYAAGMVIDGLGDVYLTALAYQGNPADYSDDFQTMKLSGAEGRQVWERYSGLVRGKHEHPGSIALDPSGDIIVSGEWTTPNSYTCTPLTVKYSGADGSVCWYNAYLDEDGDTIDRRDRRVRALALDSAGYAVITGYYYANDEAPSACFTEKYSALTGQPVWMRTFIAPDEGRAGGMDVSIAPDDSVVIIGHAQMQTAGYDFYTAKYAAGDGAILWERFYGPSFGAAPTDYGETVTVDAAGIITVGGSSAPNNGFSISLVRYSSIGLQLATQLYDGNWFSEESLASSNGLLATSDGGFVLVGSRKIGSPYTDGMILYFAPPLSPLASWRLQHFGTISNSGAAADATDPDLDGLPNLIEWGCGLNPVAPNPSPLILSVEGVLLHCDFPRSLLAASTGTNFSVEWSDSLRAGDWHTDGVSYQAPSGNDPNPRIRATLSAGAGRRFVRLRASVP